MYCGNPFNDCAGEKVEYKAKCDTFMVCNHCFAGMAKSLDTCCVKPDIIFVNQPNVNGVPSKKPFCKTCGYTSKAVKVSNINEYQTLPLITKEMQEKIRNERNDVAKRFRAWVDNKKRTEKSPLELDAWGDYEAYLKTPEWKEKRLKVFKRDKNICQGCLEKPAEHVHHLTYARIYNELLYDLISLCKDCHSLAHPEKQEQTA